MNTKTDKEKAIAYDEVLGRAKSLVDFCSDNELKTLKFVFPELKENEDERIRKEILDYIDKATGCKRWVAWLEKQGEQKPINKVEPKFRVGDWCIDKQGIVHQIANVVEMVTNHTYGYDVVGGGYFNDSIEGVRLWTISDAKDGDILYSTGFHNDCIFIFNGLDNWKFDEPNGDRAVATGYCCLSVSADNMEFGMQGPDCVEVNTVKPATKIQRDTLLKAMSDAGYTFDFDKKELKKIEKNTAWSEEDEERVQEIIGYLNELYNRDRFSLHELNDKESWLKSLKPQSHWKPSDEQIMALRWVLNNIPYNKHKEEISGLLDQIKDL